MSFIGQRKVAREETEMSGYTDFDVVATYRYGIDSRAIEIEKALEGAFIDRPVRGLRLRMRNAIRPHSEQTWGLVHFLDRRIA